MEKCEVCQRSYKKGRGLSIHQARSKCKEALAVRNANKSKTGQGQESNHSVSASKKMQNKAGKSFTKLLIQKIGEKRRVTGKKPFHKA